MQIYAQKSAVTSYHNLSGNEKAIPGPSSSCGVLSSPQPVPPMHSLEQHHQLLCSRRLSRQRLVLTAKIWCLKKIIKKIKKQEEEPKIWLKLGLGERHCKDNAIPTPLSWVGTPSSRPCCSEPHPGTFPGMGNSLGMWQQPVPHEPHSKEFFPGI